MSNAVEEDFDVDGARPASFATLNSPMRPARDVTTFIVLLRAVNVGGHNKVPMADLRKRLEGAGFTDVQTYIASGNVVCTGQGKPAAVEATVEALLAKHFKVEVPVIVRSADHWAGYLKPPFADAQPKLLHLGLSKAKPAADCVKVLQGRASAGERVKLVGDGLWIDYADSGVARSKLTPASIDKAVGSATTMRNVNTVRTLAELAGVA